MNRRTEERFQVYSPARVILLDHPEREMQCFLTDISAHGLRLLSDENLLSDSMIVVEAENHLVLCEVRNSQPRGNRFAIGSEKVHTISKMELPLSSTMVEKTEALIEDYRLRIRTGIASHVPSRFQDAPVEDILPESELLDSGPVEDIAERLDPNSMEPTSSEQSATETIDQSSAEMIERGSVETSPAEASVSTPAHESAEVATNSENSDPAEPAEGKGFPYIPPRPQAMPPKPIAVAVHPLATLAIPVRPSQLDAIRAATTGAEIESPAAQQSATAEGTTESLSEARAESGQPHESLPGAESQEHSESQKKADPKHKVYSQPESKLYPDPNASPDAARVHDFEGVVVELPPPDVTAARDHRRFVRTWSISIGIAAGLVMLIAELTYGPLRLNARMGPKGDKASAAQLPQVPSATTQPPPPPVQASVPVGPMRPSVVQTAATQSTAVPSTTVNPAAKAVPVAQSAVVKPAVAQPSTQQPAVVQQAAKQSAVVQTPVTQTKRQPVGQPTGVQTKVQPTGVQPTAQAKLQAPPPSTTPPVTHPITQSATQPIAPPATGNQTRAGIGTRHATIAVTQDTWTTFAIDGGKPYSKLITRDHPEQVEYTRQAMLRFGNAGAVNVSNDGKPIGPIGELGKEVIIALTPGAFRYVHWISKPQHN